MGSPNGAQGSPPGIELGNWYPGAATSCSSSTSAGRSSRQGSSSAGAMSHSPEQVWAERAERVERIKAEGSKEAVCAAAVTVDLSASTTISRQRKGGVSGAGKRGGEVHVKVESRPQMRQGSSSECTHSGSESTPTEQTDHTESDDMLV